MKHNYDYALIEDLRSMAQAGASTRDLAEKICARLNLPSDSFVPVFAYFREAFCVHLNTILPLQEGFTGLYARVADAVFYFSAELQNALGQTRGWTWDKFKSRFPTFDPSDLYYCANTQEQQIGTCVSSNCPKALYARGFIRECVDKSFDQHTDRRSRIHRFASEYGAAILQLMKSQGLSQLDLPYLSFDFQVEDIGPMIKVICLVQTLVDVSVQNTAFAAS